MNAAPLAVVLPIIRRVPRLIPGSFVHINDACRARVEQIGLPIELKVAVAIPMRPGIGAIAGDVVALSIRPRR